MFTSIIKATINFFYTNPSGSILNRFSKDMGVVDTIMPKLLIDAVEQLVEKLRELKQQIKKFDNILNHNTSACYMYIALNTTFGFWLDLFCCVYLALVTANCFWSEDINKGDIGLIITQAIGLTTMFQWGIKQWSEFENEMTSVERIAEYIGIESEKDENAKETWPRSNDIQFKSVTLKYKKDIPAALNNLSFVVAPKEKIGIVGRTGAGKTSIISALFRLVRFEGCILIGGVDINKVPLQTMRSKISIIPQDPVLFSGSVRENLDPFNQFEDAKLWSILDELDLKNFVSNLPAGLGSQILEKGSNLSVGQRQLFCLARALLRGNKILVLDEVTANVDLRTDSLIQLAIKTKLVDCTVLIIAHRLHTIMNCDKVLVMGAGRILEYDHPHRLLANENGALHNLVLKTGHCMTNHLKKVAEQVN
ncbi:ABC tran domain containing protein [Asbolus verrucosus]|uniref:ABC tran domain containing protein n=1 Tax=Asbolus verrucosus TaxID=1661398 RepID=A0A482VFR7_ASBVE|nr:ABC tran domain containing protein [Asbolus verrucosus]